MNGTNPSVVVLLDRSRRRVVSRLFDYAKAKTFFKSALKVVEAAAAKAPKGHPVGVYLRFAQLSTCRQWQASAKSEFGVGNMQKQESKPALDRGLALLEDLKAEVPKSRAARTRALEFRALFGLKEADFDWAKIE